MLRPGMLLVVRQLATGRRCRKENEPETHQSHFVLTFLGGSVNIAW
jgi:hypothetical protein